MQYYVALIADIKGSRKYRAEERGYLQDLTNESLLFANELFKEGIEKEVVFSAGDEVQGLSENLRQLSFTIAFYASCLALECFGAAWALGRGTCALKKERPQARTAKPTIMHAPLSSRLRRGGASILFSARRGFQTRC